MFNKNFFLGLIIGITLTVLLVIGGGYGLMWWYSRGGSEGGAMREIGLGAPPFPSEVIADYNWSVKTLAGEDFDMMRTKGKVAFINFWATWCPPCVEELPSIQKLYEQIQDDRVVFICVSQEENSKVSTFLQEKGFTVPVYTLKDQPPSCFVSRGIPATFIVSPAGKIAFQHIGVAKWDDEKSIEFIKGLLPAAG